MFPCKRNTKTSFFSQLLFPSSFHNSLQFSTLNRFHIMAAVTDHSTERGCIELISIVVTFCVVFSSFLNKSYICFFYNKKQNLLSCSENARNSISYFYSGNNFSFVSWVTNSSKTVTTVIVGIVTLCSCFKNTWRNCHRCGEDLIVSSPQNFFLIVSVQGRRKNPSILKRENGLTRR